MLHNDLVFLLLLLPILRIHSLLSISGQYALKLQDGCLNILHPMTASLNVPRNYHHNLTKSTHITLNGPLPPTSHRHAQVSMLWHLTLSLFLHYPLCPYPHQQNCGPSGHGLCPIRLQLPSIST